MVWWRGSSLRWVPPPRRYAPTLPTLRGGGIRRVRPTNSAPHAQQSPSSPRRAISIPGGDALPGFRARHVRLVAKGGAKADAPISTPSAISAVLTSKRELPVSPRTTDIIVGSRHVSENLCDHH